MVEDKILWKIRLREKHAPTGKTLHSVGGEEAPHPVELRIIQYPEDRGYYLFYCDSAGKELTDTYHESVAAAKAQAEWEFDIEPNEWEQCG